MTAISVSGSAHGILQIHWSFPPTTGGVESHVSDLAAALAARGCRIVVLTGQTNPIDRGSYKILVTEFLDLQRIRKAALPFSDFVAGFHRLLARIVSEHDIQIIHGHNLHHFHSAPALAIDKLRRACGMRVFHTFHETWPDVLHTNPVYQSWDGNYAVSRHVQEQCRATLGFVPDLFPLGVNTEAFKPRTECFTSGNRPVILHPARLLPWKGTDITIRALRILLDRGYPADLIITDTQRIVDWHGELVDYRIMIQQLIMQLGLHDFVRFEQASYCDMPRLYETADIVVYPTLGDEPYGLVPVEAMSCSRPIVASDSGGIRETVINGITGFIVPKRDAEALANCVAELIANPGLGRRLGSAGRERAQALYNAERYVSDLMERFAVRA